MGPARDAPTLIRVFVYGSLMRGGRHHAQLEGAVLEGEAATRPGHRLVLQGEYPALAPGAGVVFGEVYRVTPTLLERIDEFEGCPELYQRVELTLSDGTPAFAYAIAAERASGLSEIPGGRWRGP